MTQSPAAHRMFTWAYLKRRFLHNETKSRDAKILEAKNVKNFVSKTAEPPHPHPLIIEKSFSYSTNQTKK
jgi:hypothetical protein